MAFVKYQSVEKTEPVKKDEVQSPIGGKPKLANLKKSN